MERNLSCSANSISGRTGERSRLFGEFEPKQITECSLLDDALYTDPDASGDEAYLMTLVEHQELNNELKEDDLDLQLPKGAIYMCGE